MVLYFIAFLLIILVSVVYYSIKNEISPMPTSKSVMKRLKDVLPNGIQGTVYELGSGWGTLVSMLAFKYPNLQIIGYENSPIPYLFSIIWIKLLGIDNAKIMRKDFYKQDLSDAGLVVCYLFPGAMSRLEEKFNRELPQDSILISHTFALPLKKPIKTLDVDDLYKTKIYLYRY